MPKISQKGMQMPASPIRRLVPYAEAAKKQGRIVYHLNIGQPDIATPQIALDAVKNVNSKVIEYSHSAGNESYRIKLANYYDRLGLKVKPEHVMITTGGSEALLFGIMSCLDEGDEIIVPEPFYANYNSFALTSGAKIVPITAKIDNGFALPPIEEFEKKITPKTKAILICNPGNPTGYLYTQQELETLRDIVIKYDLFLFADEVYREFVYDGKTHYSTLLLDGIDQHLVMVDSVSKRYSMCGARIGAIVTRNQELYNTMLKFAQARLSPPTFGQIAGEAALDTPQSYFDEVITEYKKRRDVTIELLKEIPGVVCPTPGGAFYTVVQLPIEDADDFCQWMLSDFNHENQTVMMAPASGFYATKGLGKNEVRIAYVLKEENLRKAMECLKLGLIEYTKVKKENLVNA